MGQSDGERQNIGFGHEAWSSVWVNGVYKLNYFPPDQVPTKIELWRGPEGNRKYVYTLTEAAVEGTFTWQVADDTMPGKDYILVMSRGGATASTPSFTVLARYYGFSPSKNPEASLASNTLSTTPATSAVTVTPRSSTRTESSSQTLPTQPTPHSINTSPPTSTSTTSNSNSPPAAPTELSPASKAGIVAGVIVGVLIITFAAFYLGRFAQRRQKHQEKFPFDKPEIDGQEIKSPDTIWYEIQGTDVSERLVVELRGRPIEGPLNEQEMIAAELDGQSKEGLGRVEMGSSSGSIGRTGSTKTKPTPTTRSRPASQN